MTASYLKGIINMGRLKNLELIINPDSTICHLNLIPEDVAKSIILVGDSAVYQKSQSILMKSGTKAKTVK